MFDIPHSEQQNASSYRNYPIDKPFINTKWVRPTRTLSKAYPESNRDVIMNSLKQLQEKINRLEIEQINTDRDNNVNDANGDDARLNLEIKTNETENRIQKLEEQLERMRKMVNENENKSSNGNEDKLPENKDKYDWANTNKRLNNLERDTMLYDTEQFFTDRSLQNLEQRLIKNDLKDSADHHLHHHYHHINGNSKQRSSRPENTLYDPANLKKRSKSSKPDTNDKLNKKKLKSGKKSKRSHSIDNAYCIKTQKHYHLHLGDIPFVVGKSITPSHHLGSNIQNVISLLKLHHPKLCNSVANHNLFELNLVPNTGAKLKKKPIKSKNKDLKRAASAPLKDYDVYNHNNINKNDSDIPQSPTSPLSISPLNSNRDDIYNKKSTEYANEADVRELLRRLQEEYTQLVLEHYEITKRILNCLDEKTRGDYELKAHDLDARMRKKARKIAKLKNYQNKHFSKKVKSTIKDDNKTNKIPKPQKSLNIVKSKSGNKASKAPKATVTSSQLFDTKPQQNKDSFTSKSMSNYDFFIKQQNLYPPTLANSHANNYNNNAINDKNHYKSLKLFKDIKSLKNRIENDQIIF